MQQLRKWLMISSKDSLYVLWKQNRTIRPYFHENKDSAEADKSDALVFSDETYFLDTVSNGKDYTFQFEVKNTGLQPLLIKKAAHPCSCIELTWPLHALQAGESGTIKGIFHAGERGTFNREIYIHVNFYACPDLCRSFDNGSLNILLALFNFTI